MLQPIIQRIAVAMLAGLAVVAVAPRVFAQKFGLDPEGAAESASELPGQQAPPVRRESLRHVSQVQILRRPLPVALPDR